MSSPRPLPEQAPPEQKSKRFGSQGATKERAERPAQASRANSHDDGKAAAFGQDFIAFPPSEESGEEEPEPGPIGRRRDKGKGRETSPAVREWGKDKDKDKDKDRVREDDDRERSRRKYDLVFDFDDSYGSKKQRLDAHSRKAPWLDQFEWEDCKNVAELLHREVVAFTSYISPSPVEDEVRGLVIQLITSAITQSFPDAQVSPFGSYETKLYLPLGVAYSDIDLVIMSQSMAYSHRQSALYALANTLKRAGITSKVTVIARAKVPIVKFVTTHGMFNVDISINQQNGIISGSIISGFLKDMHAGGSLALRSLIMITKAFLSQRSMNEVYTGGLGSYGIVCMAISFLQMHPKIRRGEIDPDKNLGVLLMEFFELYGCYFNYEEVGISVRNGGYYFQKKQRGWVDFHRNGLISIEDPADSSNDISKGSYGFQRVRTVLAGAHGILTSTAYLMAGLLNSRHNSRSYRLRDRYEAHDMSILSTVMGVTQETINHRKLVREVYDKRILHNIMGVPPKPVVLQASSNGAVIVNGNSPQPSGSTSAKRVTHPVWEDDDEEDIIVDYRPAGFDEEEEGRYHITRRQQRSPHKRRKTGKEADSHTVFIPDDDGESSAPSEAGQLRDRRASHHRRRTEHAGDTDKRRLYWLSKADRAPGPDEEEDKGCLFLHVLPKTSTDALFIRRPGCRVAQDYHLIHCIIEVEHMANPRPQAPPINLKERIAALEQQRNASPKPRPESPMPSGIPQPTLNTGLRDKIAKFERKGGIPVPRGRFGMGAPPVDSGKQRKQGEFYGNRISRAVSGGGPSAFPGSKTNRRSMSLSVSGFGRDGSSPFASRSTSPCPSDYDTQSDGLLSPDSSKTSFGSPVGGTLEKQPNPRSETPDILQSGEKPSAVTVAISAPPQQEGSTLGDPGHVSSVPQLDIQLADGVVPSSPEGEQEEENRQLPYDGASPQQEEKIQPPVATVPSPIAPSPTAALPSPEQEKVSLPVAPISPPAGETEPSLFATVSSPVQEEILSSIATISPVEEKILSPVVAIPSPVQEKVPSPIATISPVQEKNLSPVAAISSPVQETVPSPIATVPSPKVLSPIVSPKREQVLSHTTTIASPQQERVGSHVTPAPSPIEEEEASSLVAPLASPRQEKVQSPVASIVPPMQEEKVVPIVATVPSPQQEKVQSPVAHVLSPKPEERAQSPIVATPSPRPREAYSPKLKVDTALAMSPVRNTVVSLSPTVGNAQLVETLDTGDVSPVSRSSSLRTLTPNSGAPPNALAADEDPEPNVKLDVPVISLSPPPTEDAALLPISTSTSARESERGASPTSGVPSPTPANPLPSPAAHPLSPTDSIRSGSSSVRSSTSPASSGSRRLSDVRDVVLINAANQPHSEGSVEQTGLSDEVLQRLVPGSTVTANWPLTRTPDSPPARLAYDLPDRRASMPSPSLHPPPQTSLSLMDMLSPPQEVPSDFFSPLSSGFASPGEIITAQRILPSTVRGVPVFLPGASRRQVDFSHFPPTPGAMNSEFKQPLPSAALSPTSPSSRFKNTPTVPMSSGLGSFHAVVRDKVKEPTSALSFSAFPHTATHQARKTRQLSRLDPTGELVTLLQDAALLEHALTAGELFDETKLSEASGNTTRQSEDQETDKEDTQMRRSASTQSEQSGEESDPTLLRSKPMFRLPLRKKAKHWKASSTNVTVKEDLRNRPSLEAERNAGLSIPDPTFLRTDPAGQRVESRPRTPEGPRDPVPKSLRLASGIKKLASTGSTRSMPGSYTRHSASTSSELSSEDSMPVATPPEQGVDSDPRDGVSSHSHESAGCVAWPSVSPKRSGIRRAASFAEKLWNRARTKSGGSTLSASDSKDRIVAESRYEALPATAKRSNSNLTVANASSSSQEELPISRSSSRATYKLEVLPPSEPLFDAQSFDESDMLSPATLQNPFSPSSSNLSSPSNGVLSPAMSVLNNPYSPGYESWTSEASHLDPALFDAFPSVPAVAPSTQKQARPPPSINMGKNFDPFFANSSGLQSATLPKRTATLPLLVTTPHSAATEGGFLGRTTTTMPRQRPSTDKHHRWI
ncbi:hypothetical protein APHAL10511_004171 [Amanita phalloides]|nr:hypothetical protein APHAL10511_004171 [Amanita phalloides]